ncbi:MAG: 6-bladed beta-propeller [Gemmatimonadales bacterium]|nr:6-bladed beta-propeller [Gemmatimonadales bacterium]
MRIVLLLATTLGAFACDPSRQDSPLDTAAGVFGLNPTPVVQIGVTDGPFELQFHKATSARRLADGRIVVADGDSKQLRWFDAEGRYLHHVGRKGEGPGEFRGVMHLIAWPGDTIAVLDPGLLRLSLFDLDGEFVRSQTETSIEGSLPWVPWLSHRTVVFGAPAAADRACVMAALAVAPAYPIEQGVRFLVRDEAGRLWLREGPDSAARWTVLGRNGAALGTAELPPTFDLVHAGESEVIGRVAAEDGTERIVAFAITDSREAGDCLPPVTAPVLPDSLDTMKPHVRNLMVAEEATYADLGQYSTEGLERFIRLPEGKVVWVHKADKGGWMGGVLNLLDGTACVTAMGNVVAGGWRDGAIICG